MIPRIENVKYCPPSEPEELCKDCAKQVLDGSHETANEIGICQFCWPEYLKKCDHVFNIQIHSIDNHGRFVSTVTDHGSIVFTSRTWNNAKNAYEESDQYCKDNEYYGFEN